VGTHWYEWEINDLPSPLRLYRSQVYGDALFDRRVPEAGTNAPLHRKFGVDMQKGAVVVVRPDSYVGAVVELSEDGWLGLNGLFFSFVLGVAVTDVWTDYFAGFLNDTSAETRKARL
jgi:hypothetical protein